MKRRWSVWRANPNTHVQLAVIALHGAIAAGALSRGNHSFLIMAALLLVATSAWQEGAYADAVGDYLPQAVQTGTWLRLSSGVILLAGIWIVPALVAVEGRRWWELVGTGALFGGLALMCGGAARLLMTSGARAAGRALQDRLDDDY
jgi:hypothetical protein